MRDYSKISPQFWIGSTGRKLRESGAEAMLVSLYLLSNPHANMLGLYYLPRIYIAHETGLGFEGASKGLRRAIEAGFCDYDEASEVVFVYEMARFQIADQLKLDDKRCTGSQREYNALPNNPFLSEFYEKYEAAFHLKTRRESTSPFDGASKGHRSQEQEQEQEQEIKSSAANASVADVNEKLPPQTAQEPSEIIPPPSEIILPVQAVIETPDGLHPNQYATRLLEEIGFLPVPKNIRAIAAEIEREAKAMGLPGAYEFILKGTRDAMFDECEINANFFTDGKYRPERRNNNGRQVSAQRKRTSNTQRNDALSDDSNPDPRHAPIRELVHQMHLKQFRVKCQWDGSEGKALDRLLSANPSWSQEQIAQMVRNRFESEGIASDRPRKWLPNIGSYAAGPQDRFNKLKGSGTNGNGHGNEKPSVGQIVEREIAILHARRAQ